MLIHNISVILLSSEFLITMVSEPRATIDSLLELKVLPFPDQSTMVLIHWILLYSCQVAYHSDIHPPVPSV